MSAAIYNIKVEQGSDFTRYLTLFTPSGDPIDISNWTFEFGISDESGAVDYVSTALAGNYAASATVVEDYVLVIFIEEAAVNQQFTDGKTAGFYVINATDPDAVGGAKTTRYWQGTVTYVDGVVF